MDSLARIGDDMKYECICGFKSDDKEKALYHLSFIKEWGLNKYHDLQETYGFRR